MAFNGEHDEKHEIQMGKISEKTRPQNLKKQKFGA